MDDLTPCRIKESTVGRPWLRLNNQFMDMKKTRCFSGPPTHFGYCATELESAKKLFFWFALARTFLQHPYPMWVDADDMWEPQIPQKLERQIYQTAFAIGYAENECIEARFPANNPIAGVPELNVCNPMTPLSSESFWSQTMRPYCGQNPPETVTLLITAVDTLFGQWKRLLKGKTELPLSRRSWLLDDKGIKIGAGIAQVKAYAEEVAEDSLLDQLHDIQELLTSAEAEFSESVSSKVGLNYFGVQKKKAASAGLQGKHGSKVLA